MSTYGLKKKKQTPKTVQITVSIWNQEFIFIRVKECKYHISYSDMKS